MATTGDPRIAVGLGVALEGDPNATTTIDIRAARAIVQHFMRQPLADDEYAYIHSRIKVIIPAIKWWQANQDELRRQAGQTR